MTPRWRPTMAFVLGGALFGTLCLSLLGLVLLRYIGPEIGFRHAAVLLALCIALATAVLGWLLVRLLLRPIQGLEAYASAHERGDEPGRLRHYGTKEILHTAQGVVAMAEALRDREASVRSYTDHVTHELKTPVSVIRAASELLADAAPEDAQTRHLVAQIEGAVRTIQKQLDALRAAAQARETRYVGQCRLADVDASLAAAVPRLEIVVEGADVVLPIARDGLLIVLQQLVRNAAEHGADRVVLQATPGRLEVRNNGAPIATADLDQVFDPFFTTRRDVGGTGMGLSIARNVLSANGGRIAVVNADAGAAFSVSFG